MEWLRRPLLCDGAVVSGPLDPSRLVDEDLREICLRMHVILENVEMPRCEGRLMPVALFDSIDTLESMLLHNHPDPSGLSRPPRLTDWSGVIREFGQHYQLTGTAPITVDPASYREIAARYSRAAQGETNAPPDRQAT